MLRRKTETRISETETTRIFGDMAASASLRAFLHAFLLLPASAIASTTRATTNNRPVIGILAQPPPSALNGTAFIPASYIKWLESAGARIVPLPYNLPAATLSARLSKLNGLLFPGGDSDISITSKYGSVSYRLFKAARAQGIPIWGTCMGFEQTMLYSSSDPAQRSHSLLSHVDAERLFVPLDVTSSSRKQSRILSGLPAAAVDTLLQQNCSVNLHAYGILSASFAADGALSSSFRPVATNADRAGKVFVSLAEHVSAPIFASQFHPEKNAFEFDQVWDGPGAGVGDMHTPEAVQAMASLAAFFVGHARRNANVYPAAEFLRDSIFNYAPVYSNRLCNISVAGWEQAYVF